VEIFNIKTKKKQTRNFVNPGKLKSSSLLLKTRMFWPRTETLNPKSNIFLSTVVHGLHNSEGFFLPSSVRFFFFD